MPSPWKRFVQILKRTFKDFDEDAVFTLSAALAFYSALSLAPLLLLMVSLTGFLGDELKEELVNEIVALVGPNAGKAVQLVVQGAADEPDLHTAAGIASMLMLLFSAAAVFGELQAALNAIWDVKASPYGGIWGWLRKRLLSMGIVVALGFLLLLSMGVSAALSVGLKPAEDALPLSAALWQVINFVVPLAVFTIFFALIYWLLPDVRIAWRDVWFGAIVTAVLFSLGKLGIGFYIGRSSVGSAYGAAGSLIVLLVWVYYSSLIVFFGAELTHAWAALRGRATIPEPHAKLCGDLAVPAARG